MRNPEHVLSICDSSYLQAQLFDLSSDCNRLSGRLTSRGVSDKLSSLSACIAKDSNHSRSQELMEALAEIFTSECLDEIMTEELDR